MLPGLFYARRQMPLTQRRMTTPAPMKKAPFRGPLRIKPAPKRRSAAIYILSFRTLSRRCAVALLSRVPVESSTVTVVSSPVAAR
jgi:hypothetical protein